MDKYFINLLSDIVEHFSQGCREGKEGKCPGALAPKGLVLRPFNKNFKENKYKLI